MEIKKSAKKIQSQKSYTQNTKMWPKSQEMTENVNT